MKLIHFRDDGKCRFGCLEGDQVKVIKNQEQTQSAQDLIQSLHSGTTLNFEDDILPLEQVQLLAPVPSPQKIICIGRNYADHAREMGADVAELPIVFSKFANTIANPEQNIALPKISEQVDYEAELVVVIGRGGLNIDESKALEHVFGVCCGNDVSARDWQKGKPGGQWLVGKSFDGFAPIGPWIVTLDELDIGNLDIQLKLNGEVMQQSNTRNLIFKIETLIAHVSQFFTLVPGDLLFTGTPSGVGAGRQPPRFIQAGDSVSIEIAGIGTLTNRFV